VTDALNRAIPAAGPRLFDGLALRSGDRLSDRDASPSRIHRTLPADQLDRAARLMPFFTAQTSTGSAAAITVASRGCAGIACARETQRTRIRHKNLWIALPPQFLAATKLGIEFADGGDLAAPS